MDGKENKIPPGSGERLAYIELIITLLRHYEYIFCKLNFDEKYQDDILKNYAKLIQGVGQLIGRLDEEDRSYFYAQKDCGAYLRKWLPEQAPPSATPEFIEN